LRGHRVRTKKQPEKSSNNNAFRRQRE
jgi:hypothetical protein